MESESITLRAKAGKFVARSIALIFGWTSISKVENSANDSTNEVYEITITRSVFVAETQDKVFDFLTAEDAGAKVLTGSCPLPAVVGTSNNVGPWNVPGSTRQIIMADGSTVQEQVTYFERPGRFSYKLWNFTNPFMRATATGTRAEWMANAAQGGTTVTWTYIFTAKGGLTALMLSGFGRGLWRRYMDVGLGNIERQVIAAKKAADQHAAMFS